ncbi:MAG: polyisoprenoid-binding protein [Deltaproteobacteria bacterium]|nr:polyisoprenoid-binding protein [Deltaproteobacteria bacterium]
MRLVSSLFVATLALGLAPRAVASEWAFDPEHTEIGFTVRHMMVSNVNGAFDKYGGKLVVDDKDFTKSSVTVDVDMASVNSKSQKRDDHLRKSDFFDVAKFPKMTFRSTKIENGDKPGAFRVTGDLTLRGVTKPVVLETTVSDEWKAPWADQMHRGITATGKINRHDFGVSWQSKMDKGGVVAGDEVTITISAEVIKVKP